MVILLLRLGVPLLIDHVGLRDVHDFRLVVLVILLVPQVLIFPADLSVLRRGLLHDAAPAEAHEHAAEVVARAVHDDGKEGDTEKIIRDTEMMTM